MFGVVTRTAATTSCSTGSFDSGLPEPQPGKPCHIPARHARGKRTSLLEDPRKKRAREAAKPTRGYRQQVRRLNATTRLRRRAIELERSAGIMLLDLHMHAGAKLRAPGLVFVLKPPNQNPRNFVGRLFNTDAGFGYL